MRPLTARALALGHGRINRRLHAVSGWNSRDGGGVDQRISLRTSPRCAVGSWPATDCRKLATALSAALDKVLRALPLSNSAHAAAAPPSAQATMSALPTSFSPRCWCARAGISNMVVLAVLHMVLQRVDRCPCRCRFDFGLGVCRERCRLATATVEYGMIEIGALRVASSISKSSWSNRPKGSCAALRNF